MISACCPRQWLVTVCIVYRMANRKRELPLTTAEAAAYLGMSENAFKLRRSRGLAPQGHPLGGLPTWVYWPEELDRYKASNKPFRPRRAVKAPR
jgi:hypothetical protein